MNPAHAETESEVRLAGVLEEYLAAFHAGNPPDKEELLARHPELAEDLAECLTSLEFIRRTTLLPASSAASRPGMAGPAPVRGLLGDYRIVREIGRGGMGVVYEAEQISLGRSVALKVLPFAAALDSRQLQRFKNEAQAAAQLHHTNIVPVFAIGCERGLHYYAMQYIEGRTLAQVIADLRGQAAPSKNGDAARPAASDQPANTEVCAVGAPYSPPKTVAALAGVTTELSSQSPAFFQTVARLGEQAARALDHAHEQGIVHRDVKPGNLLVDGRGQVWITDFGLAHLQGDPGLTMSGDLVGTLRYMSPEQAAGKRAPIDHRTDIYSLGASLYELLTLHPAHDGADRQEVLGQILNEEPRRLRGWNRALPMELETIVLKAMAKEPEGRYASAVELANDLRSFLDDRPILARRPTIVQRALKWTRRHKGVVAAILALLPVLVLALATSTILIWSAQRRTREALDEVQAQRDREQALIVRAEEGEQAARHQAYAADLALAQQAWDLGQVGRVLQLLERQWPQADEEDLRGFEWYYLWRLCHRGLERTLRGHTGSVLSVAFSVDGKLLASGGDDGTVRLWEGSAGQALATFQGHRGSVTSVSFAPDGRALASAGKDGMLKIWDLATAEEQTLATFPGGVLSVAISPDGQWLAAAGTGVRLWNLVTRQEQKLPPGHRLAVRTVAFSPDSKTLASGSDDRTVRLWDVNRSQPPVVLKGHDSYVLSVAFSSDGQNLAAATDEGSALVWDLATRQRRPAVLREAGSIYSVAFVPDGKELVCGGEDGGLKLWNPATGTALAQGQAGQILAVAIAGDGQRIASGASDGTIHLWRTEAIRAEPLLKAHADVVNALAFSPDGRTLAAGIGDGHIRLWDTATRKERAAWRGHAQVVSSVAFSPDGRMLASASHDSTIKLWNLDQGSEAAPAVVTERATLRGHLSSVWRVAFSPDGRTLASAGYGQDRTVRLWDVATGQVRATLRGHDDSVWSVAFSPDGRTVASGSRDNTARLWDVATGQQRALLSGHPGWVWCLAFSRDGRTLAAGCGDGSVKLWDPETGTERGIRAAHPSFVRAVAFLPDGTLLTGSNDRTAKLWDLNRRQERFTFKGHRGAIWAVAVSPDGKTLATGGADPDVRLWPAATEQEVSAQRQ
jgi:WD40 repeat protein/serine/threonine protein kinase